MSKILIITAADEKFQNLCQMCSDSAIDLDYETIVYDLGKLGFGKPFNGRFSDQIGAKIPSKPSIILDALHNVDNNDYVVWLDADAIIWDRIDEIKLPYDIGVTVRKPKAKESDSPINAGVCFFRKTPATIQFVKTWIEACKTSISDQMELNRLLRGVTTKNIDETLKFKILDFNINVKIFPCDLYNNWYFKTPQTHAKITHYKSKYRRFWPTKTIKRLKPTVDYPTGIISEKRFKEK
jgi:hypothetical protein